MRWMLVYEALRDNSHTLSLGFIHKAPLEFHPSATTFGSGFLNYFFILIRLLYTKADYWLSILDIVFWFGRDVYFTCLTFSIQNLLHIYIYGSPISHYRCVFLLYLIIFVYFATKKKKTWYAMPWYWFIVLICVSLHESHLLLIFFPLSWFDSRVISFFIDCFTLDIHVLVCASHRSCWL